MPSRKFNLRLRAAWMVRSALVIISVLGLWAAGLSGNHALPAGTNRNERPPSQEQTNKPTAGYVGSQACAPCHKRVYEQFTQTHMGRSISRITPALLETVPGSSSIYDPKTNRRFDVYARDGKLYQSEYETDSDGRDLFRETHEIEWIIGAGANGFGGIIRRGNYLFEAPLSFYSKPRSWGLSPGYESVDFGFNRPMLAACIACHSGRPQPDPAGNGRFREPAFSEMAIGCENCHGPGLLHVQEMQLDMANHEGGDYLIVDPAKLRLDLADNICMSCHQTGDVRVLKPGKNYESFRPGTPLDDTLSIFMVPPKRESPAPSDLLGHYYSMSLSKCYRASQGRLGCITCHDPHSEPSRAEAPAYFAKKCLACHTEQSCTFDLSARRRGHPPDDCSGCHMPKRAVQTISHSALTNHRIVAQSEESLPEAAFHQTTSALPDLVDLNAIAGRGKVTPAPPVLTLLQAYGELLDKQPQYQPRYLALLDEAERKESRSALVQAALGRRDLRVGKWEEAIVHLQRALETGPAQTAAYQDLADALVELGRTEEAIAILKKAISTDPFNPVLQKTLVLRFIQLKQYAHAEAAMEQYMELFPSDPLMRQLLARAKQNGTPK
jgi:hypothetical protein